MEIRTLKPKEHDALHQLLSGWGNGEDWRGPESFRRQVEADPYFEEQNVWVAVDGGELVACASIHPRRLRILGHGIPTGGIGAVYTAPDHRGLGIASALIEAASIAMRERGLELAITFAKQRAIFQRLGFNGWRGERSILRHVDQHRPPARDAAAPTIELVPLERERNRALSAVKAIHSAYSGSRNGTVIRDDGLWDSTLALAGNPSEEFWVARRGGLAVAYGRATLLDEGLTITEVGRFEDGAGALAKLVSQFLEVREDDMLAANGRTSAEVRSFAILPTFDDIGLTVGLEHEGVTSHPVPEESGLIRCLNINALAARLDVALLEGEDGPSFLRRILPPDGFVFWPSDRF
jgi:GNAT superfamily N-acetyltransferase